MWISAVVEVGLAAIFVCLELEAHLCLGTVIVSPTDTKTFEGASVLLQCEFALPTAATEPCYWLKDGAIINIDNYTGTYAWLGDFTKGNCSIRIVGVANSRDDGRWWCQIPPSPTDPGDISQTARLTVYVKPTPPTIYYKQAAVRPFGKVSIAQNDTADIQCVSRHGNPAPKLTWYLNDSRANADNDEVSTEADRPKTYKRTVSLLRRFGRANSGKVLRCTLQHIAWPAPTTYEVTLDILYGTTSVDVDLPSYVEADKGERFTFQCTADGNPAPQCEWLMKKGKDGHWVVKAENCDYSIASVDVEDEGSYMCLAGNGQLLPSQEISLVLRNTKDMTGLIGGLVAGFFLFAIIILVIVVYSLRRKVLREAHVLPTREHLDDASNRKLNVDRGFHLPSDFYTMPLPTGYAPLKPPLDEVELRYVKRPTSSSSTTTMSDTASTHRHSSHIYADPHIYENVLSSKKEGQATDDDGYIDL